MKQFILMADIVHSSQKSPEPLMKHFQEMVGQVNEQYADQLVSPLTVTLGDEFQGIPDSLEQAIEMIFTLDRLNLTAKEAYRLRFVIHYGNIETPVNVTVAHGMLGEGLTRARKKLEEMKKGDREIWLGGLAAEKAEKLMLAFGLYRTLYTDWPEKDRSVAFDFIEHRDYKKVAVLHDRDSSSMWRKERSLKMKEFESSKKLIRLLAND